MEYDKNGLWIRIKEESANIIVYSYLAMKGFASRRRVLKAVLLEYGQG